MIKFTQLDPRTNNNQIFESGPILGIEITIPELAAKCTLGNIDHYIDIIGKEQAAINAAYLSGKLPDEFTIAILKPDCDSIGAAAIIVSGSKFQFDHFNRIVNDRVELISKLDRFAKDPIWHPQELPSKKNLWPSCGGVESSQETAALQAMCGDNSISLKERVWAMSNWLRGGDLGAGQWETGKYQQKVEKERQELISALENGQIKYCCLADSTHPDFLDGFDSPNSSMCIVTTTHRAATLVGYCMAPVVIAINPEFRFRDLPPVRKVTICAWSDRYLDIQGVIRDLNELEPGWGGHGNICGSPQGSSTNITTETIIEVVQRHLKKN